MWAAGVPLQIGIPVVLVVGVVGGLFNGAAGRPRPACRRWSSPSARSRCSAGSRASCSARVAISELPGRVHDLRLRLRPRHADPVDARRLRGPRGDLRHRRPHDVDRAARSSRSARTAAPRATPASASQRPRDRPVRGDGPDRRAGRRDPHRPVLERPCRQRQRHDPDSSSRSSCSAASTSTAARARSRASSSPSLTLAVAPERAPPRSVSRASTRAWPSACS